MGSNSWRTICLVIMVSYISMSSLSYHSDTILPGQSINSNQTIISQRGKFEFGFFSPGYSSNFYAGIWHKGISNLTVVWVANRDRPILSSDRKDAYLTLSRKGRLQLQINGRIIWSTSATTSDPSKTTAVLQDSGNLVVGSDGSTNKWESFNYPTDTWLPGAKIGLDVTAGKKDPIFLTSWSKQDDPRSGIYLLGVDLNVSAELILLNRKTETKSRFRLGQLSERYINFTVSMSEGANYFIYNPVANSTFIRMVLDYSGLLRELIWDEKSAQWLNQWTKDYCDSYAACGDNGICSTNQSPACSCPQGFQPKDTTEWESNDHFSGCVKRNGLQCLGDKDEFIALDNIKWPKNYRVLPVQSADSCRLACAANCSCSAYSSTSGCHLWFGELLSMTRTHNSTADKTLYLRLGSNELPKKGAKKVLQITLALSFSILLVSSLSCYIYKIQIKKGARDTGQDLLLFNLEMSNKRQTNQVESNSDLNGGNRDLALPIFSLSSVFSATDNFSAFNKLGQGGFGPVYKGKLHNGEEVAVKRLSKHSCQGLEELINEAKLIAKLQHTNLVRLLGCCIQQDEKILIYEYMPNKSLDFYLFDQIKKNMLDWSRRMHIIEGIAQGLLYLHHYSRVRIIHRDLKASNILLDADMKPKISDFGMARIFGGNQLQANTKHIAGTFGYMAPEYALEGLFSIKTDIFSFGVLLLEILSGKRNTRFCHEDSLNLLGYAWKLWINDTPLELIDPILKASCHLSTALRYVHVGLLCVQEHPDDRPSISAVVAMIGNEMKAIEVQPKQPAYIGRRRGLEVQFERFSLNELTYSTMQPR